jgi:signal transduction histidine kinase
LRLREKSNDLLGIIQSSLILGDSYVSQNKYALSEDLYLIAKSKAQEFNAKKYEIIVYKKLFYLDSIRGNYKRALEYSSWHHALKDSLFTLEKDSQLAKIQTVYEVEKMDKENVLLLKDKEANKNRLKYQRLINIGGGLSMIILVLLSIALLIQVKKQNKTHNLLKIQNDKILNQKNKLLVNANKLRELNENLEKTVKDRTGVILRKNEKLKEFAYMNAHNVRGPLSNILGLTYLLDKQSLEGEQKELVEHLNESAKKLDDEFHLLRAQMENEERS